MFYKEILKKVGILSITFLVSISSIYAYNPTNKDTKMPPTKAVFQNIELTDDYILLHENENLAFYFREDRDVLVIKNIKSGEFFKTGLDLPLKNELEGNEQKIEAGLNKTFTAIANSLITVEYYDKESIKRLSSSGMNRVTSKMKKISNNKYKLDIDFKPIDLQLGVEITFTNTGLKYDIPKENINGEGKKKLAGILITPFLGASGGMEEVLNLETGEYSEPTNKYLTPGYIFIPDGSGSLIRFEENNTNFVEYVGDVYGENPATKIYHENKTTQAVDINNPLMPVFGISHGDNQKAFVSYASKGSEYMSIVARPKENMNIPYYWAYPRFEFNNNYFKVYNKKGEGYFTQTENYSEYDISISYDFLYGDGSDGNKPANYVGMALTYKDYLKKENILVDNIAEVKDDIPIRLDFIMSDSKKSIIGTKDVVVTKSKDVEEIIKRINENGIININSGLIGWQENGETLSNPNKIRYSNKVGSKDEIERLTKDLVDVDISLSKDFLSINEESSNYDKIAIKHINGLYPKLDKSSSLPTNVPVSSFSYANPNNSIEWVSKLSDENIGSSITIEGITDKLVSSYDNKSNVEISQTDSMDIYKSTLDKLSETRKLNLNKPNMYLWSATDRFLQSPVNNSSYIFETDTIPFLQIVLNNQMEVYAPYSNFSFYSKKDMLRMIDYNVFPSFILSKEPSYLLQDTNSSNLYSTESELYIDLIGDVYKEVNSVLKDVQNYNWIDRQVLSNGIVLNTYRNDSGKVRKVIINYTENSYSFEGKNIEKLSAEVIM